MFAASASDCFWRHTSMAGTSSFTAGHAEDQSNARGMPSLVERQVERQNLLTTTQREVQNAVPWRSPIVQNSAVEPTSAWGEAPSVASRFEYPFGAQDASRTALPLFTPKNVQSKFLPSGGHTEGLAVDGASPMHPCPAVGLANQSAADPQKFTPFTSNQFQAAGGVPASKPHSRKPCVDAAPSTSAWRSSRDKSKAVREQQSSGSSGSSVAAECEPWVAMRGGKEYCLACNKYMAGGHLRSTHHPRLKRKFLAEYFKSNWEPKSGWGSPLAEAHPATPSSTTGWENASKRRASPELENTDTHPKRLRFENLWNRLEQTRIQHAPSSPALAEQQFVESSPPAADELGGRKVHSPKISASSDRVHDKQAPNYGKSHAPDGTTSTERHSAELHNSKQNAESLLTTSVFETLGEASTATDAGRLQARASSPEPPAWLSDREAMAAAEPSQQAAALAVRVEDVVSPVGFRQPTDQIGPLASVELTASEKATVQLFAQSQLGALPPQKQQVESCAASCLSTLSAHIGNLAAQVEVLTFEKKAAQLRAESAAAEHQTQLDGLAKQVATLKAENLRVQLHAELTAAEHRKQAQDLAEQIRSLAQEKQEAESRADSALSAQRALAAELGVVQLRARDLAGEVQALTNLQSADHQKEAYISSLEAKMKSLESEGERHRLRAASVERKLEQFRNGFPRSNGLDQGFQWQYEEMHEGRYKWESFKIDDNDVVQEAYKAFLNGGQSFVDIKAGNMERRMCFESKLQTNLTTGAKRNIRLKLNVPSAWELPPEELLRQTSVSKMYVEERRPDVWTAVSKLLMRAAHSRSKGCGKGSTCRFMSRARVKAIYRIENYDLWQRYCGQKRQVEQDLERDDVTLSGIGVRFGSTKPHFKGMLKTVGGDCPLRPQVNEAWLFHGTVYENVDDIVRSGFDPRVGYMNNLYGSGVYFASESCKSHQYTCEDHRTGCDCPGERSVILSRVILGDPFVTRKACSKTRRAPQREKGSGFHNSLIASPGRMAWHPRKRQAHQEFVIFDMAQAYPSFVIRYEVQPAAE